MTAVLNTQENTMTDDLTTNEGNKMITDLTNDANAVNDELTKRSGESKKVNSEYEIFHIHKAKIKANKKYARTCKKSFRNGRKSLDIETFVTQYISSHTIKYLNLFINRIFDIEMLIAISEIRYTNENMYELFDLSEFLEEVNNVDEIIKEIHKGDDNSPIDEFLLLVHNSLLAGNKWLWWILKHNAHNFYQESKLVA